MAARKRVAKPEPGVQSVGSSQTDADVIAFLRDLDHPLKAQIEAVRRIILGVSPEIREGIKWNSPSFRTSEYFATLNLRAKDGEERVWLILHTGAKAKAFAKTGLSIEDPIGMLKWLAKDRALVVFASASDIKARQAALKNIIRQWIAHL